MIQKLARLLILFTLLNLAGGISFTQAEEEDFSSLFATQTEFLKVDQAFQLTTEIVDDEIIAKFEIAEEYYMYRSRFFFSAEGASLGEAYIPGGKKKVDEYLGDVEVYYHNLEISVPFSAHQKEFTFIIEYQGCAEAGLCYPPEEKKIQLFADKVVAVSDVTQKAKPVLAQKSAVAQTEKFVPEQEKVSNFLSDKSLLEVVLYMILLGIGLAFTPCVLPMVPILSSIIVGQGENITLKKSFLLSLTYTQSMAIPFAALGLLVGGASEIFGTNINSNAFQSPVFIIPAAVIFLLLSLSMFGFYELQLPASMRNKLTNLSNSQEGGTYIGTSIMGALSALVVSPCVTVPVAGVLLFLAQTGDAMIGGVALYSLAVGMGIPLLLVGMGGGKLLPKAGGWMNSVKAAFGVAMIAMALYISKHLIPGQINMLLWAILLITTAVYMGALSTVESNIAKLWKSFGIVLLIYGLTLIVGASMGNNSLLKPLKGLASSSAVIKQSADGTHKSSTDFIRVKTIEDVKRQVAQANAQGKTVMFDFFAVSCTACYEFEEFVFPAPSVKNALKNTVLIQADVTANDAEDKALMEHFEVQGLPSILLFDAKGNEDKRLRAVGFEKADIFTQRLNAAFKK